jgi:hypothetical protein
MRHARDIKPDMATAAAALRPVLAKSAPDASGADLKRFSESIAVHALMLRQKALAAKRGTAPALESLVGVKKKILALASALESMGEDELEALNSVGAPSQAEMLQTIADLNAHIVAAHDHLADAETVPTRGKGKPRDAMSARIAEYAAGIFERITGQQATFYYDRIEGGPESPFGIFLSGVFKALAIDASAEHYARLACEKKRKVG